MPARSGVRRYVNYVTVERKGKSDCRAARQVRDLMRGCAISVASRARRLDNPSRSSDSKEKVLARSPASSIRETFAAVASAAGDADYIYRIFHVS